MSMSISNSLDPYETMLLNPDYSANLLPFDNSTKMKKKWNKLKSKFSQASGNMLNGALMGFCVGGMFGGIIGIYLVFQTRRFLIIPLSILSSGATFGFILGVGSAIRSAERVPGDLEEMQWLQVMKDNQKLKRLAEV